MIGPIVSGEPLTTLRHTCMDTAQTLADVSSFVFAQTDGSAIHVVIGAIITCETHDVRFAWGVDPTNDSGTGIGHILLAGQGIKLTNPAEVADFRFCNKTDGSNAVLQITAELSKI